MPRLGAIKTSLEGDANLRASVNSTENVLEIPTMLIKDDKENAESQKASKQELNHTLQAEGRKQDRTPTLTTEREHGVLNFQDRSEKVSPSYRTDKELNHTHQQEVRAEGTKQDLLPTLTTQTEQTFLTLQEELRADGTKQDWVSSLRPSVDPAENVSEILIMLLNDDKEDTESLQTSDKNLNHTLQQEVRAEGSKQDVTPTLTSQREQTFLNLPDRPETESPSYRTDLFVTMQSDHSSKTFGEVSSSHTAMPHYAFDFPQPHVSSQDAADILEKIAQRHLQNRKV